MKKISLCLLALLAAALVPALDAQEEIEKGDIVVIPLKGEIAPAQVLLLRRATKAAEAASASAVILDLDTYGGRLDSAEKLTGVLGQLKIPTYSYINTNAGSAGAIIALATDKIYMAPVSAIGAAAPILSTGEDLPATAKEKTISYWSALIRASATSKGHNPDVGEAFMNKEKEVRIGDKVVHEKGTVLTLSAQEAAQVLGGKPVLAAGIADSIEEVVKKAGLKGEIVRWSPSGFEQLALWITALAPVLLLVGIIGAYLEFKIPGISVFGIISAVCFVLFFLGHYLAGLAGWETVALFVLGLIFIALEIFLFASSSIVFGIIGVLLVLGSLLMAMVDRYPSQDWWPTGNMLEIPLRNLMLALIAAAASMFLLARYLPRTSLYRRFALMSEIPTGPSIGAGSDVAIGVHVRSGMEGVALTTLRPSGKARFDDQIVDVVSSGDFIPAEARVVITQTDGMRVVVQPAP